MKTFYYISSLILLAVASGCSTSQQAQKTYDDDIYSSSSDVPAVKATPVQERVTESAPATQPVQEENADYYPENRNDAPADNSTSYTDDGTGNTYITNNYNGSNNSFNNDDYYDYAYSARIRRFHRPVVVNYYDSYYTNSYWYDYNPYGWGVSIYTGYSFWNPRPWGGVGCGFSSWGWNCGVGMGYGWSSYPSYGGWGWNSPYYGGGWGWNNGYRNGYMHGYNDGFNNGFANNYYYNSYDNNSYNSNSSNSYYGHRGSSDGSGSGINTKGPRSIGSIYQTAVATENTGVRTLRTTDTKSATLPSRNVNEVKAAESPRGTTPATTPVRSNDRNPSNADNAVKAPSKNEGTVNDTRNPVNVGNDGRTPVGTGNDGRTPVNVNPRTPAKSGDVSAPSNDGRRPDYSPRPSGTPSRGNTPEPTRDRTPVTRPSETAPSTPRGYERPQQSQPTYQDRTPSRNQGYNPQGEPQRNYEKSNSRSEERPAINNYERPASRPQYNYTKPATPSSPSYSAPAPSRQPAPSHSTPSNSGGNSMPRSRSPR